VPIDPPTVERLTAEVHDQAIEGVLSDWPIFGKAHGRRRVRHNWHRLPPRRMCTARRVGVAVLPGILHVNRPRSAVAVRRKLEGRGRQRFVARLAAGNRFSRLAEDSIA
jgi:hypothetical protein